MTGVSYQRDRGAVIARLVSEGPRRGEPSRRAPATDAEAGAVEDPGGCRAARR